MKTRLTPDQTNEALSELGIDPLEFALVQSAPSYQEAVALMSAFKVKVKKLYRAAARRLHPDLTKGDPDKQELFCLCTQVHEEIQDLRVHPPVRAVPFRRQKGTLKINIRIKL